MTPAGRAVTDEQKRAVIERLLAAWQQNPALRLGQTLVVAADREGVDMFYVEDERLAEAAEMLAKEER